MCHTDKYQCSDVSEAGETQVSKIFNQTTEKHVTHEMDRLLMIDQPRQSNLKYNGADVKKRDSC